MNTTTLISKLDDTIKKLDRANEMLRQQELSRLTQAQAKTHIEHMDRIRELRKIANDINPAVLR